MLPSPWRHERSIQAPVRESRAASGVSRVRGEKEDWDVAGNRGESNAQNGVSRRRFWQSTHRLIVKLNINFSIYPFRGL